MENNDFPFSGDKNENTIDFKNILLRGLRYWYIFVISIVLSISLGFYIHKTTIPKYTVSSLLLISDSQNEQQVSINSADALPGVNLGKYSNIENQIIFLTSSQHIENVIRKFNFSVSYYKKNIFLYEELYKNSPFIVVPDTTSKKFYDGYFYITFTDKEHFNLINENNPQKVYQFKFYEKISIDNYHFSVLPNKKYINAQNYSDIEFSFRFNTLKTLVNHYKKNIYITPYKRESSVYKISLTETNIEKGIEFLNKLAISAVDYNLDKKNQIANNTIKFIEKQLSGVSDSLSAAEQVLEEFRSSNELMDVSMQGQIIINQSQELENQKAALLLKTDYYNYLLNYIEKNQNIQELMAPSSMGIDNPILTQLIGELSTKNAEKLSLQFNSKADNPNITRINRHIENIKKSILENTKSLISTTEISLADLNKRLMNLSSQIRKLPKKEQLLSGIERKFKMNDEMYTFLMEKRSEAQLAKASNLPDNEIIEKAYYDGQIAPNVKKVIIIVFILGLILPGAIIFSSILLNNKIQDKNELKTFSDFPIIGEVPKKKEKKDPLYFLHYPKSAFAESIRSIRTNLDFYAANNGGKTILVTSTISGEGKTFFSINLGASFALLGKKTIIVGFDLRKPKINNYLNLEMKGSGLSKYLIKDNNTITHNLIELTQIENLEIIPGGEIPPNPSELIAGEHTKSLFEELKKVYDIIIIDTPPIGLVTDAQLLSKYADVNIITSRHNYTPKSLLKNTLHNININKMQNICHILNGLPDTKNGYSYGYYGGEYYKN